MAKGKIADCKKHLKGTNLSADDVQSILDEAEKLDESQREDFLRTQVLDATKQNRQILIAQAHDAAFVKRKIESIIDGSKSYTEALRKIRRELVGRAGVDSSRIVYKNRLLNMLESFEASAGTTEGLRKLQGSSALEKEVYIKVHQITEPINVQKLLGKDAKAYREEMLSKIAGGKEVTEADKMAFTIAAYNEYTRLFMREHGIPTAFHKNFVVKRRYDPKIIEEMGENKWAQFMADRVNAKASFGVEMNRVQLVEKLTAIAGKIKENDDINAAHFNLVEVNKKADGSHELKHKFKQRRELVFNTPEAEYEVFDKLSSESLAAQVQNSAWALSSEAMKTKHLGYNSAKNYDKVLLGVRKEMSRLGQGTRQPEIGKWRQRALEMRIAQSVADLSGTNKYTPTGFSTLGTALKLKNSVGLLGNAVTTAMLDPLDAGRQMFYVNGEMFGGMVQWTKNFAQVLKHNGAWNSLKGDFSAMQELNAHIGAVTQYIATDSSMRMARGEIAAGGFSLFGMRFGENLSKNVEKWSSNAMKIATMLPQQTAISKTSSGLLGAQTFTDMVDLVKDSGWGSLNKFQKDTLAEYGITKQDMELFGMVERYSGWGDSSILSGKMIREAVTSGDFKENFEQVRKIYNVDEEGVISNIMNAADKYELFLTDFFTRATPTPELAVKTSLYKASNNELINVINGLMTQFYDTPMMQLFSYKEMIDKMNRLHAHEDPNVREWIKGVGAPIAAQTVVHMGVGMSAYLMYDHIWSAALGKDSKFDKLQKREGAAFREIMYDVAGRTSAIPFAFEAVNAASSRYHNGSIFDMMKSPTLSLGLDTGYLINSNNKMTMGKYMKKHLTPNAWWWQMTSNHLGD